MYSVDRILNNPWLSLQDLIGDAKSWPQYIRQMFWDKSFTDLKRLKITFSYQNGVSEKVLHTVLSFTIKEAYSKERRRNISARYAYFNDPREGFERRERTYALDLIHKRVLTLNGNPIMKK